MKHGGIGQGEVAQQYVVASGGADHERPVRHVRVGAEGGPPGGALAVDAAAAGEGHVVEVAEGDEVGVGVGGHGVGAGGVAERCDEDGGAGIDREIDFAGQRDGAAQVGLGRGRDLDDAATGGAGGGDRSLKGGGVVGRAVGDGALVDDGESPLGDGGQRGCGIRRRGRGP